MTKEILISPFRRLDLYDFFRSEKYTQGQAVLFTNDGPGVLRCGKIPDVLATLDFGAADNKSIDSYWATLRKFDPSGPLVNAEFYPGWLK